MLHMIESGRVGGESMFVDGFAIADQLRIEQPDVYRLLTTVSLEYIEEGYDVHKNAMDGDKMVRFDYDMASRHKVIRLVYEAHIVDSMSIVWTIRVHQS